ncbi:MAG: PRC-barrel domain-containing protein [Chloroflexota bacterium]
MTAQIAKQTSDPFVDAASVTSGMRVYSRDGEKLGIVRDVWAHIFPHAYVSKSRFGLADYGPVRGTLHLFDGADGYVQVMPRRGIRRENEQDLYIPLDAIQGTVPGQALTVAADKATCHMPFATRPQYLDGPRTSSFEFSPTQLSKAA